MDSPSVDSSNAPSSSPESFAFLNHSTVTVHRNLPPDVDDRRLARQKRKRTSPEDAAILETAYQRDPKPDKAARLELVSRVALDEKGVQIWFQNRRQTSRRKSRPLLPHEIVQYQQSRADAATTFLGSSCCPEGLDDSAIDLSHDRPASSHGNQDSDSRREQVSTGLPLSLQSHVAHHDAAVLPSAPQAFDAPHSSTTEPSGTLASIGYLANRRSADSMCQSLSEQPMLSPAMTLITPKRQLRKSSSFVRLSMNAEGKAEIVTKDASSPSPPRMQQVMYPDVTSFAHTTPALPAPRSLQRSASGRSRDSRSWEFCCDKEARSQLGQAAEKDARGSAAGAIELLRTASGRNILGSIPSKRNSTLAMQHSSVKRSKLNRKRGPLQRSITSTGRLQGDGLRAIPKLKHSNSANSSYPKGTDSDKENWSPDPETNFQAGNASMPSQPTHDGVAADQSDDRVHSQTNALTPVDNQGKDGELAVFMRGGRSRKRSSTSGDDLDCVQGLLSLSQGNWR